MTAHHAVAADGDASIVTGERSTLRAVARPPSMEAGASHSNPSSLVSSWHGPGRDWRSVPQRCWRSSLGRRSSWSSSIGGADGGSRGRASPLGSRSSSCSGSPPSSPSVRSEPTDLSGCHCSPPPRSLPWSCGSTCAAEAGGCCPSSPEHSASARSRRRLRLRTAPSTAMALGLWVVVAARAAAAIPYARTQVFRTRGRPHHLWHSDVAQVSRRGRCHRRLVGGRCPSRCGDCDPRSRSVQRRRCPCCAPAGQGHRTAADVLRDRHRRRHHHRRARMTTPQCSTVS